MRRRRKRRRKVRRRRRETKSGIRGRRCEAGSNERVDAISLHCHLSLEMPIML